MALIFLFFLLAFGKGVFAFRCSVSLSGLFRFLPLYPPFRVLFVFFLFTDFFSPNFRGTCLRQFSSIFWRRRHFPPACWPGVQFSREFSFPTVLGCTVSLAQVQLKHFLLLSLSPLESFGFAKRFFGCSFWDDCTWICSSSLDHLFLRTPFHKDHLKAPIYVPSAPRSFYLRKFFLFRFFPSWRDTWTSFCVPFFFPLFPFPEDWLTFLFAPATHSIPC